MRNPQTTIIYHFDKNIMYAISEYFTVDTIRKVADQALVYKDCKIIFVPLFFPGEIPIEEIFKDFSCSRGD